MNFQNFESCSRENSDHRYIRKSANQNKDGKIEFSSTNQKAVKGNLIQNVPKANEPEFQGYLISGGNKGTSEIESECYK